MYAILSPSTKVDTYWIESVQRRQF